MFFLVWVSKQLMGKHYTFFGEACMGKHRLRLGIIGSNFITHLLLPSFARK
jgi:hypothetical protein